MSIVLSYITNFIDNFKTRSIVMSEYRKLLANTIDIFGRVQERLWVHRKNNESMHVENYTEEQTIRWFKNLFATAFLNIKIYSTSLDKLIYDNIKVIAILERKLKFGTNVTFILKDVTVVQKLYLSKIYKLAVKAKASNYPGQIKFFKCKLPRPKNRCFFIIDDLYFRIQKKANNKYNAYIGDIFSKIESFNNKIVWAVPYLLKIFRHSKGAAIKYDDIIIEELNLENKNKNDWGSS